MSIELKVYDNGDHTCLVWLPDDAQPVPGCRGFTIRRLRKGQKDPEYLHGFVGFSDSDKLDPASPWKFPLQRFLWWDYFVKPGDVVQYAVVPVVGPSKDGLRLAEELASPLTPELEITGQCSPHLSAYFNKGIVAAQWVARALAQEPQGQKIKAIVANPGDPLRNALSGLLRPQILKLLAETKQAGGKIFAALYELDDKELVAALEDFGADCSLILGNGAFGPGKPDENHDVRQQLRQESKVQVFDRMVGSGHFAHNKFVVFCDAAGKPQRVLTGSTNWTSSGLCTQANNSLIIADPAVAADFLAAWNRIKAAGDGYPVSLVSGNSTAQSFQVDGCRVTPWFVKTSDAQDLEFARQLINGAKEGILFLFFDPGTFQQDPKKWTLLQNILDRHHEENNPNYNPNLYLRGVVNQDIPFLTEAGAPKKGHKPPDQVLDPSSPPPAAASPVALFSSGIAPPQRLGHDVLVPHNIKDQFHDWEKELLGASLVNIHSKVIVLDPFGDHPVVMTGSHNLGFKASNANDDNLVVIEGNGALAAAYAINIIAVFQTYRWNSYVEAHRQDPKVWHGLVDSDGWQASYLASDELAEIRFWLGHAPAAEAPAAGVPGKLSGAPEAPQGSSARGAKAAASQPVAGPAAATGGHPAHPTRAAHVAQSKRAAGAHPARAAGTHPERATGAHPTRAAGSHPERAAGAKPAPTGGRSRARKS